MLTTAPRGTKDIMPGEVHAWLYLEQVVRRVCALYGYREIRTPVFEHTELFQRGIGDTTDVVEKEMYTFVDRGKRSITLRPENTASVVRAYVEHKLSKEDAAAKFYYIGSMFRYDRPQAGRLREFHQFGVEVLGAEGPNADAEIILLALEVLKTLGLKELKLKINSVGCPCCRPLHREKLQAFFADKIDEMCPDCKSRYSRNPLRLLDCKVPHDHELGQGAPVLAECLCEECREHFAGVQQLLKAAGVSFEVDNTLVRGLDYYTKTAFEIQYPALGAQSAVCGGGRYDGLVQEISGDESRPGIGFAMGLERVLIALEQQQLLPEALDEVDCYLVSPRPESFPLVFASAIRLREAGCRAEYDYKGRSLKAQMKQANKCRAKKVLIFGEDEAARGMVTLRDMATSEQREIPLQDIISYIVTNI